MRILDFLWSAKLCRVKFGRQVSKWRAGVRDAHALRRDDTHRLCNKLSGGGHSTYIFEARLPRPKNALGGSIVSTAMNVENIKLVLSRLNRVPGARASGAMCDVAKN